jgi:hypothetical protein
MQLSSASSNHQCNVNKGRIINWREDRQTVRLVRLATWCRRYDVLEESVDTNVILINCFIDWLQNSGKETDRGSSKCFKMSNLLLKHDHIILSDLQVSTQRVTITALFLFV